MTSAVVNLPDDDTSVEAVVVGSLLISSRAPSV